jgi:hypothetical protein
MAIEDYYVDLHYVTRVRQPDGTGGFDNMYQIGESFKGTATKSTTAEQQVAGIRGEVGEQYTITTPDKNPLFRNNVLMFVDADGERVFVRLNSNITHTPEKSGQKHWKYCTATRFEPDLEVVG